MNQFSSSLRVFRTVALGGLVAATATLLAPSPGQSRPGLLSFEDSPKTIVDEAWQLVNQSFVDGTFHHTDWQATRKELLNREYTSKDQAYAAIRVALKKLDDPYTRFMDPDQFTALTTQTSGELSGIGVKLEVDKTTKILTIVEPMEGSPAMKMGLKAGDQLLAIDGKTTRGMDVGAASTIIRGKPGTPVKLTVNRIGNKTFDVTLQRAVIELPTVTTAVKQEGKNKIGYIRLGEFNAHAAQQVKKAIETLSQKQVNGFILDLRENPGGLLDSSIDIARLWLKSGTIVRTEDRAGRSEKIMANNSAITQLPLTVLVNNNSASSSEILTGALKDNGRATVVGTRTFGKALVQAVHQLSDGSGLAVTVAHYYTPNGTDISHKGINPDVAINISETQLEKLVQKPSLIATAEDPQYMQAVRTVTKSIQAYKPSSEKPAVTLTAPIPETQTGHR
jgi:carboxyl-terminal processing protease